MKTKEEFIKRFEPRLTVMALYGLVTDQEDRPKGPYGAGARALEFVHTVPELLSAMYDYLKQSEQPIGKPAPER